MALEKPMYNPIAFSPVATLTSDIAVGSTVIPVSDVNAFPPAPSYATIGTDENAETIKYSAKTADSLSGCTRAVEGVAQAWQTGEKIARNFTAADHQAIIDNLEQLDAGLQQAYSPNNKPTASDVHAMSLSGLNRTEMIDETDIDSIITTSIFNVKENKSANPRKIPQDIFPNGWVFVFTFAHNYYDTYRTQFMYDMNTEGGIGRIATRRTKSGDSGWTNWSEISYLPLSGGTLTGALNINASSPELHLVSTQSARQTVLYSTTSGLAQILNQKDSNNYASLSLYNESADVNGLLFIYTRNGSVTNTYMVYGEHNMKSAPKTYDIPVSIANFSANGFNKYWKDKEGYVHITFNIKSASASNSMSDGNVLFTLPVGFRPTVKQVFYGGYMATQTSSTRTACEYIIDTDGTCKIYKGGTTCAYAMFSCTYYVG